MMHDADRGTAGGFSWESSVAVNGMYLATMKALTHHRVSLGGGGVGAVDRRKSFGRSQLDRCKMLTAAVNKEDEHGNRTGDRNFPKRMKCINSSRKQRNRDLDAPVKMLRSLTSAQDEKQKRAWLKPEIRERRGNSRITSPPRQMLTPAGGASNFILSACVSRRIPFDADLVIVPARSTMLGFANALVRMRALFEV
jgi:hypothetical protein